MLDAVRVVVITDRRLVPIVSIAERVATILAAVPRGSVLVQIREKDLDGRPLLELAREVVAVAHPAGAPVFINDRLDVALAAGADGVHLPESGLSIADARAVMTAAGQQLAIGCSRHTPAGVLAAAHDGAEFVHLGPIWATPGKGEPLGTEALALHNELPPPARLVAVGGIDSIDRGRHAQTSGADAIAVIRAAWGDDGPARIADLVAVLA